MFLQLAGLWLLRDSTPLLTRGPRARYPRADRTLTLPGQGCPRGCKLSILANHSSRTICLKSIKSGTPTKSVSKAEITWGAEGRPGWGVLSSWLYSGDTPVPHLRQGHLHLLVPTWRARPRSGEALLTCGLGTRVKQRTSLGPSDFLCNLPTHLVTSGSHPSLQPHT